MLDSSAWRGINITQVTLKFTGHVRSQMKTGQLDFSFEGSTLRELLGTFFAEHDVRDLLLDDRDQLKPYARFVVEGRFSDFVGGLDARVVSGNMVTMINPYFVMWLPRLHAVTFF
jgi:molybdopterin converting factor small subunit